MNTPDITTVIGAIVIGLVTIINAVGSYWGRQTARKEHVETIGRALQADRKLDEIHELTNSNLSMVKSQLKEAKERIDKLESLILSISKSKSDSLPDVN